MPVPGLEGGGAAARVGEVEAESLRPAQQPPVLLKLFEFRRALIAVDSRRGDEVDRLPRRAAVFAESRQCHESVRLPDRVAMLGHVEQEEVQLIGRRPIAGFDQQPLADLHLHRRHHFQVGLIRRGRQILRIQGGRLPFPHNVLVVQTDEPILR